MVQEEENVNASDEQYQFIDDGNASDQFDMVEDEPVAESVGESAPGVASVLAAVKTFSEEHRGMFFAIVILFSVTVIYQFVGGGSKKPTSAAAMQASLAKKGPPATKKEHASNASGHEASLAHLEAMHNGMHQQLATVQQTTNQTQAHINSMGQDLQQSKMHVAQIGRQNELLVSELNRLNAEVGKLNARVFPPRNKVVPLSYSIQAIVPGRAWLTSNRGETMTIQLGTELPVYGTVRAINADAGLVMTSSGRLIHFSLNR